jgi:hypothetical protein
VRVGINANLKLLRGFSVAIGYLNSGRFWPSAAKSSRAPSSNPCTKMFASHLKRLPKWPPGLDAFGMGRAMRRVSQAGR